MWLLRKHWSGTSEELSLQINLLPEPGSPPCPLMAFCLRLTLFTLRFLMSVNTGIKPEQIAAWEQTELLHLICLLCLQVNHGNRSETCLLMTNLLMVLFDRAPWPWAPPWRTRCDVHSVSRGLSSLQHNKVQAAEDCHNIYATCSIITHSLNCQSRN